MGTLNVQKACEFAAKVISQNTNKYAGYCLTFVGDCYKAGGGNFHSSPTHYPDGLLNYCTHRGKNDIPTGNNIPPGAAIWMYGSKKEHQPSHIGLSLGGGWFADPWKPTAKKTVQHILNNGKYYGWGWLYGNTPSGSYNGVSSSTATSAGSRPANDSTELRNKVVQVAKGQVGTPESQQKSKYKALGYAAPDNGWCCSFVAWVYKQVGVEFPATYACITAADWFSKKGRYKKVGTYTPQPGDCVFFHFDSGHKGANHIEIVTGASGGKVYTVGGNTPMGPGKGDGVAEKTRTGSIIGYGVMEGSYGGGTYSDGTTAEQTEPPHIPQTEKVYTLYEGDNSGKKVDKYAVIVESRLFGTTRDITNRCGNIIIKDDSDAVCTELTFDLVHNNDDKYLENLNVVNGDIVAVKNTASKETIFLGQIQTKSLQGNVVSYGCVDMGFILTKNDVIMQFDNIAFKDALPKIAKRLGIEKVSCPNLISSIYGVKKEKAGDIIKSALDTVTEEVGLKYFIRMKGSNILTVQSFAEKPIQLWRKATETTGAFKILDEIAEPSINWSIEDLANEVIIYSDADNAVSVKADIEDTNSINRYFRRIRVESISDNETVSADAKAKNMLNQVSTENKEVSLSCYNSDKAVAGAMIQLKHYAAGGDYWIKSVEHNISDGTMSLNLMGVK